MKSEGTKSQSRRQVDQYLTKLEPGYILTEQIPEPRKKYNHDGLRVTKKGKIML